jgi:hypothetical protein
MIGSRIWVLIRPTPRSRWLDSTRCPTGPSAVDLAGGRAVADPLVSTPGWAALAALASQSKKELSLTSSNLTEENDDPTSSFQAVKESSVAVAFSSTSSRSSRQLSDALVDGGLVQREARLDLLSNLLHKIFHEQLGVGLHGSKLLLTMSEMVMLVHIEARTRPMNLIPIVSLA